MFKIIILTLLFLNNLKAQEKLELNSDHSQIQFAINYLLGEVKGSFDQAYGELTLGPDKKEIIEGKVFIRVRSIHSGHKTRDGHLLGKDFFQEKTYPHISFTFQNILLPALNSSVKIKGQLQIKDLIKTIEFDLFYLGEKIDPWNKPSYFFTLSGLIDRRQFDINWNKSLDDKDVLIDHEVRINASLQWQEFQNKTPSWLHMVPEGLKASGEANVDMDQETVSDESDQASFEEVKVEVKKDLDATTKINPWLKILSQLFVSLMGFVGCIAVAIFARTKVQSIWQEILGLIFMLIFSMSLYYALYS